MGITFRLKIRMSFNRREALFMYNMKHTILKNQYPKVGVDKEVQVKKLGAP